MRKPIIIDGKETGYEISDIGEVFNLKTGRQLKGIYARNEYHSIQLRIEGKSRSFLTHRLVAEAFIPNPDNFNIVDHINRDKHDNRVNKLRWVDDSTNILNREKAVLHEENFLSPEQVAKED